MATITLKGNEIHTNGELPVVGSNAKEFKLVKTDLTDISLGDFVGKKKVLNIFPSLDTPTCAASVRNFNKEAADLPNTVVLNISADLPFAQARFCGVEGIENAQTASCFRSRFAQDYGLEIIDGPLAKLCSRVVIILDENNKVIYTQQVTEIVDEPDYQAALAVLK